MKTITLVNRLGNKKAFAPQIWSLFPKHDIYIEPFFGSGAVFFSKQPVSQVNHLNDLDDNITNLYFVLKNHHKELICYLELTPYSTSFWEWAKTAVPENKIEKAALFVILSNWGYRGKPETLSIDVYNKKRMSIQNLLDCYHWIAKRNIQIQNKDFRAFFASISMDSTEAKRAFAYCDKPYTNTANNYGTNGAESVWRAEDDADLLKCLFDKGLRFGISEYDGGGFEEMAKAAGLKKIFIDKKTCGLGAKRKEVIWVNYEIHTLF